MTKSLFTFFIFCAFSIASFGQGKRYVQIIQRDSHKPLDSLSIEFYHVVGRNFIKVDSTISDSNGVAAVPAVFSGNGKVVANSRSIDSKVHVYPMVENVHGFDSGTRVFMADLVHPPTPNKFIQNVYFSYKSDSIVSFYRDDKQSLPTVIELAQNLPAWKIEIWGHTDNIEDSASLGIHLSEVRADHIKAYLISKGIDQNRLSTKAGGSSMPKVPNEKDGKDDPEGRARNRRVEFKMIPPDEPEIEK